MEQARRAIAAWYETHGRHDLPWRLTRDPYAIYVSEIMLQQTQVATVRDRYYAPFLARFPDVKTLAEAPLEDVLKAWEGLGYYRRAKHLHAAARACGGAMPETVDGLMALPGVGRNTAHAVAAFAYRTPVPVMEANVRRVLRRVFALKEASEKLLWEKAAELLGNADPFIHNQAMMDIGATICMPAQAACGGCPLTSICRGKQNPASYDAKPAKKAVPVRSRLLLLVTDREGRIFASPREGALLHGMYAFPELEPEASQAMVDGEKHNIGNARLLGRIRQVYSHFRLEAEVRHLAMDARKRGWLSPADLAALPLSRADRKALALLSNN
ncbi:MAG: A/G-specific adenine glycosylase [Alphaproteobacteria bacterium]|nr:A/G-specific adenine glycosylase [Alphaproteobacteria bacterium]